MKADSPAHFRYIDGLRALAVLGVVAAHAWPHVPTWVPPGTRGVELFFVISGLCLALPYLRGYERTGVLRLQYARFLIRRFVRIAPPFYAALLLFALLGFTPFGFPTVFASQLGSPADIWREFGADLFFAIPRTPVHNVVFWTLAIEARWYLVCPALVLLYVRSKVGFAAVGIACYVAYFAAPVWIVDLGTLPCFMLGIVAADLVLRDHRFVRTAWAGALVAVAIGTIARNTGAVDRGDPIWHVAAFLVVVAASRAPVVRLFEAPAIVRIGAASFSIYLIHAPVIAFLRGHALPGVLPAIGGIGAGLVFWYVVERAALTVPFRTRAEGSLRRLLRLRAPVDDRLALATTSS